MELSIVRERFRLNRVTLNRVRKRFCVEDEKKWTQHRTLWYIIGKASTMTDCVLFVRYKKKTGSMQYQRCHTRVVSIDKYTVVNGVKGR